MYPTVGYGLTSLHRKLEAGAQSAGGWAHSSRHRTGPTGHSNKVTTPPLAIIIRADLYFILSELTRVQSGGGFGHKILNFKQPTIICLMQILQTTNNLPKDTGRFLKVFQCWDTSMQGPPLATLYCWQLLLVPGQSNTSQWPVTTALPPSSHHPGSVFTEKI